MAKILDQTNLGYFYAKLKAKFWPKTDVVNMSIDSTPTSSSTGLVTSGGVYSAIDGVKVKKITTSLGTAIAPNAFYVFSGTATGSVTFTLSSGDSSVANHYYWTFNTGSTAPTITWPASITAWNGGSAPTINANKHYEVSLLDGVAAVMETNIPT